MLIQFFLFLREIRKQHTIVGNQCAPYLVPVILGKCASHFGQAVRALVGDWFRRNVPLHCTTLYLITHITISRTRGRYREGGYNS